MLCIVLNNTIHGIELSWKEKREETQVCKYLIAIIVILLFTIKIEYITWLFAYCKGGNLNIHIWVWLGYFIC